MPSKPPQSAPNLRLPWTDLLLAGAAGLLFLIPLGIFAYTGTFTRFIADEYDTLAVLKQSGFWGAQGWWYQNWSGRYSFTFFVTLVEVFDARLFPWITAVLLGGWLAAAAWAIKQAFQMLGLRRPTGLAVFSALVVVYFSLVMETNLHQVLYWVTGILTYVAPLIVLTILAGVILRHLRLRPGVRPGWGSLALVFGLALLAGGFSETSLVLQIALSGLLLGITWLWLPKSRRADLLPLLAAALAGSLLALAIVGLAPGNAVRVGHTTEKKGLLWAIPATWGSLQYYILGSLARKTTFWLICLLAPAITGYLCLEPAGGGPRLSWKQSLLGVLLSILGILLLAYVTFFPANYMLSDGPPERSIVVMQYLIGFAILGWSLLAGAGLRRWLEARLPVHFARLAPRLALVVLLIGLATVTAQRCRGFLVTAADASSYAQAWDQRDRALREAAQAGQAEATVDLLWRQGELGDLSPYFDSPVNAAAAKYYGLERITAQAPQ